MILLKHTAALLPYLVGIGASLVQPPTPPDQLQRIRTAARTCARRKSEKVPDILTGSTTDWYRSD